MSSKILFVDDTLAFIQLADSIKTLPECEFTRARSFEEAAGSLTKETYDLIILNINFPLGNVDGVKGIQKVIDPSFIGMDLLFYIRERNETVPIIGLSVADSLVMVKIFEEEGAFFYSRISANSVIRVKKKVIELIEIK